MAEASNSHPSERDQLAGVYVYIEGPETINVPPHDTPLPPVSSHPPLTQEVLDELAGVYVEIIGPEIVRVPPRPPAPPETPDVP